MIIDIKMLSADLKKFRFFFNEDFTGIYINELRQKESNCMQMNINTYIYVNLFRVDN